MMYLGGKNRSGENICCDVINPILQSTNFDYIEPFVGSGGVFKNVYTKNLKIINDYHYFVFALHDYLRNGGNLKKDFDYKDKQKIKIAHERLKKKYSKNIDLKNNDIIKDGVISYIGFSCSFAGIWFGTFASDKNSNRCFYESGLRSLPKNENYKNTIILNLSYEKIIIGENNVIYCDPPYSETTKYKCTSFDYNEFINWCREKSQSNIVLISEYDIKENDFVCIYSFEFTRGVDKKTKTEKIYTHKNCLVHRSVNNMYEKEQLKQKSKKQEKINLF